MPNALRARKARETDRKNTLGTNLTFVASLTKVYTGLL